MLPQLPFSRPLVNKDRFGSQLMIMLVTVVAGTIGFTLVSKFAYQRPARLVGAAVAMLAIGWVMTAITRLRVRRMKVEDLYFD
jgi:tetrahydromethanopterin S-methyltransferase subunit E